MGLAVITYTGQNFGAGNIERIRKGLKETNISGVVIAYAMSLIMIFGGITILSIFIDKSFSMRQEAIEIGNIFLFNE